MESIDLNPSILRKILFIWIAPIISYYKLNKPSTSNLLSVSNQEDIETCTRLLSFNFELQCQQGAPNLTKVFIKTFYKEIFFLWALATLSYLLMILECILIYYIIIYIEDSGKSTTEGLLLCLAFIVQAILCAVITSNSSLNNLLFSAKTRRIFTRLVLEKCLKMHGSQINSKNTHGKCMNLITSDMLIINGLNLVFMFFAILFTFPALFIATFYYFGGWGVIGIAISFIHIPVILALGSRNKNNNSTLSNISNKRVTLIQNLIEGINVIKLNAWELPYLKKIYNEKGKEAVLKRKLSYIYHIFGVFAYAGVGLILFITLSLYVKSDNELDSSKVFFLISIYFFSQTTSIVSIVLGVVAIFEVLGAFKRLEEILLGEEFHKPNIDPNEITHLSLSNVEFSWKAEISPAENEIENLNSPQGRNLSEVTFHLENSGLIIVVGESGSGKTTLLVGLLQEIYLRSGKYAVNGSVSYAAEQPWLVPDTVKNNIILGKEFHEEKYRKVLKSCNLFKDLEMLPKEDESVIGDRGVTLSGGQKSRIGLARALYSDSEIFLLDDPLSAVDTEVGNHLFAAIKELSEKKIVVLSTHQLHFLSQADKIIVLDKGTQIFCGTPEELEINTNVKDLLGCMHITEINKENIFKEEIVRKTEVNLAPDNSEYQITLNFQTYLKYLLLGFKSKFKIVLVLILMLPSQIVMLFMLYWCGLWLENDESNSDYYIIGLGAIVSILYITSIIRSYPFYSYCINSSKNCIIPPLKVLPERTQAISIPIPLELSSLDSQKTPPLSMEI